MSPRRSRPLCGDAESTFASWYFQNQPCMLAATGSQNCNKDYSGYKSACNSLGGHLLPLSLCVAAARPPSRVECQWGLVAVVYVCL